MRICCSDTLAGERTTAFFSSDLMITSFDRLASLTDQSLH